MIVLQRWVDAAMKSRDELQRGASVAIDTEACWIGGLEVGH
jgi:hypothetical protein